MRLVAGLREDLALALVCSLTESDGVYSDAIVTRAREEYGLEIDPHELYGILMKLYLDHPRLLELSRKIGVRALASLRLAPGKPGFYKVMFLDGISDFSRKTCRDYVTRLLGR